MYIRYLKLGIDVHYH